MIQTKDDSLRADRWCLKYTPPPGLHWQSSSWLLWGPLQSLAVKKNFFLCNFWAVENFKNLLKSAGEIFLSGLRGAKNLSNAFRIVFRIFFRVFQTVFSCRFKSFSGQFRSADMPPLPLGFCGGGARIVGFDKRRGISGPVHASMMFVCTQCWHRGVAPS